MRIKYKDHELGLDPKGSFHQYPISKSKPKSYIATTLIPLCSVPKMKLHDLDFRCLDDILPKLVNFGVAFVQNRWHAQKANFGETGADT